MSTSTSNNPLLNRRWGLIIAGITANACLGTVYSWSVFRGPLEAAFSISGAQSALPYSVFLAAFAFSMPLGGALIGKWGSRLVLAIGGLVLGLGWFLAGISSGIVSLILSYGIVGGLGVGLAYGVPLAVAGSWFPARRGFAMGIVLAGFGVSPFVTAPLAELLINAVGVRSAMIILGGAFVLIVGSLSLVLKMYRPGEGERPSGTEAQSAAPADVGPREMLRRPAFYGFWVCYMIGTLAGLTAIGMTATFGRNTVGLPDAAAALAVSLFGVLNGLGRPVFGAIHDRLGTRATSIVASVFVAVAALLSMAAAQGAAIAFFIGFGLFWFMLGGWLAIAPAATTRLFGAANYAKNYGVMYTAYGVGALAGGAISGRFLVAFGSHRPFFLGIIILCALAVVVAAVWIRPSGTVTSATAQSRPN